ncbi:sensor histidine kinase [Actinomadura decatromicini]|uniref:histidine kinase n=1 Tax=Actinomadura decatromicini TaxID=2604572 RepID=A0A5D3FDM5_9ACTN|nr:histidine kinase [Actinomadura decatromicini]TYK46273.1 sensor histidine kinase [Actinomadura decatromicini]
MNCGIPRPKERAISRVLVVILLTWGAFAYLRGLVRSEQPPALHGFGLGVVAINVVMITLLAAGARADHRRDGRWRTASIVLLVAALVTSLAFYGLDPEFGGSFIVPMIALWALFNRLPLPWGVATSALTIVMLGALGEVFRDRGADFGLLVAFLGVTLGAVASSQGAAAREATRRAEAANAVLAERSHIAREIHDILAHSLSAQIVHLEGARLLLARDGDRVQALDRVERAGNLARSGLEETKRALATLRGEIPEPKEAIAELAEEFYASTGRPCDVEVTGVPRELPAQAGLTVVRTAQEALTNVRKHAPGARAHVALRYLGDRVELEVTDSGATESVIELDGGGYGLVGMRERAELIDGTLITGPDGKGFRVSLKVPV